MKRETIEQKAKRVKQERNNKLFICISMAVCALMFLILGTSVNWYFLPFFPVCLFLAMYNGINASIADHRLKVFILNDTGTNDPNAENRE